MSIVDGNPVNINCLLTFEEANTLANKVFKNSSVKVLSFNFKPYSEKKLGFTSSHQLLEIVYHKNNSSKPEILKLFVKAVAYDNDEQRDLVQSNGIFYEEVVFFDKIFPFFDNLCKGEKWCPIVYLVKNDFMIMQELRSQGYKLRGNFFDQTPVIKSTLDTLARFHSCSILAEAILEKTTGELKTLSEHYPNSFSEKIFTNSDKMTQWVGVGVDATASVAEHLGLESEKLRKSFEKISEMLKPSSKHRNVICHGDLWTNNMMFDDTKPKPKCILVDFQTIRYCPLVLDIIQFLYVNTSKSWREEHEKELIEYYYNNLKHHVKINDETKRSKIPTLEDTLKAYNEMRLFGSCSANLYLPISLLDSNILAAKQEKEGFSGLLFGSRNQQTLDYMKKDDFYKARIEENVRELVEISKHLI